MEERGDRESGWRKRLLAARRVWIAAGLVFSILAALGAISLPYAAAGFVAIAAAAWFGRGRLSPARNIERGPARPATDDPLVGAIIANLPDAVIVLDGDGRVLAFNARASAIAPALGRGEPVSMALRAPAVVDAIRRAAAGGGAQRVEFSDRVPVDRWLAAYVTPIEPTDPGIARRLLLLSFHDLTPLRRVEEMRADFVANASHELRTPLAALSGFIHTLRGPARNDPLARDRFLNIMEEQANRMARLIGDLLSLSRIELNEHRRPDSEVDLVAIVRQVIDGLQTLARDREVEVQLSVSAERVTVRGDRDELIRLFENLVENALKYAASGKRVDITLSLAEAAREVRVAVRDYGPGIAPDHLPRLTERFYRVDVSESRAQGGTGLGLALVKHILNRHGGRLTIESVPAQGATFTAHLPIAEAAAGGGS